jgi:hypothetical protein
MTRVVEPVPLGGVPVSTGTWAWNPAGGGNGGTAANETLLRFGTTFTLEAWIKTSATVPTLVMRSRGYGYQIRASSTAIEFSGFSTVGSSGYISVAVPEMGTAWHHIAVTAARNKNQVIIYRDGAPVLTTTWVAAFGSLAGPYYGFIGGFGIGVDGTVPADQWRGSMCMAAVYPTVPPLLNAAGDAMPTGNTSGGARVSGFKCLQMGGTHYQTLDVELREA